MTLATAYLALSNRAYARPNKAAYWLSFLTHLFVTGKCVADRASSSPKNNNEQSRQNEHDEWNGHNINQPISDVGVNRRQQRNCQAAKGKVSESFTGHLGSIN